MPKTRFDVIADELGPPCLFVISFIVIWEAAVRIFAVPEYLLPGPSAVVRAMYGNAGILAEDTAVTAFEAAIGFLIANIVAFSTATLFAHSSFIARGLYPFAIGLKTTPIVALSPLLVLWLGPGIASKIVASSLICFFPILVNATKGLTLVDPDALLLFDSLGATKWQVFRLLRLPNSLPYLFSALKVSSSLSVVGAVVGEFVGANVGLGYWILISSYHIETATMFGATFAAAGIGIVFFVVISQAERLCTPWAPVIQE